MKSVKEFWFRIGIGVALILVGVLTSAASETGAGVVLIVLGLAQLAWTAIAAQLIVRKAQKMERAHTS